MNTPQAIVVRGARQHNLKSINLDIPKNKLVVITGLSGSGKSSLAFDTLYAEGQRRYVESLSAYARQFLERMEKPDVDLIEGLSPAIAIEQKTASHNPRSTVGTVTEIYDYLRLLYARIGVPHCYQCGQSITSQSVDQMIDQIVDLPPNSRIIMLAPLIIQKKGSYEKLFKQLKKDGFARVKVDGTIHSIEDIDKLPKNKLHNIDAVIDRLVLKPTIHNRLSESIELALSLSKGLVTVEVMNGTTLNFSESAACIQCGISYSPFTPASFSFNSPQGACTHCGGLGALTEFDPDLIVPNPNLSIREGAIAPWATRNTMQFIEFIESLTRYYKTDIYTPFVDLPEPFKKVLLNGSKGEKVPFSFEKDSKKYTYAKPFEGIIASLEKRYKETDSQSIRNEVSQYMNFLPCTTCAGAKLKKESLSVKIDGRNISEITAFSISDAIAWITNLNLTPSHEQIASRIIQEISQRLIFLKNVGLNYLTLDRKATTLSGGESQRIRLATQIGSKLTGVLYVLDEPSIGLHQRDNNKLIETLEQMRDLENTVLVVEHDEETIKRADYIIDIGPGAGKNGGQLVFAGTPSQILKENTSLTGQYLSGKLAVDVPSKRRVCSVQQIQIVGARENNLKNLTVNFPIGCFICVTGVSGSGKSSLVTQTLYPCAAQHLYRSSIQAGTHESVTGLGHIDKVINIDQSPIGKTPRSNPSTYTNLFTHIRDLFARTPEARLRGYKPGRFSFNVKGGRCEACQGDGIIKIEMHFLPDVYIMCDVCLGKRYNRETLEIRYKGKSIADVLCLTVNQGLEFFKNISRIHTTLQILADVGLGYIQIGQPATTLSGGESQRIKIAKELSKKITGRTLYILDEPTTGLHMDDVQKLISVLNTIVDKGNTVVVIEHNLDMIKVADYVIDLGPEGGDGGGEIIFCGSPEELAQNNRSHTGIYLKQVLTTVQNH